jgi:RluA family pseudouridine synthase
MLQGMEVRIVWQDEHLLAVDKPAGLLSHPSADLRRDDLVSWLKAKFGSHLTMHHRLDKETSGLLLFSLSEVGRRGLAAVFEQRLVKKTYWAWVKGCPPRSGKMDKALGEQKGRVWVQVEGLQALTEFRRKRLHGGYSWLELYPHTGRKHQLRVHCASSGWPILGDSLYRGESSRRLWLHAVSLELRHPVSGELLRLESQPQDWSPWGSEKVAHR